MWVLYCHVRAVKCPLSKGIGVAGSRESDISRSGCFTCVDIPLSFPICTLSSLARYSNSFSFSFTLPTGLTIYAFTANLVLFKGLMLLF